jgi:hypothetical protein
LVGRFRRGSGITGFGGAIGVVPVVIGAFCWSDAVSWTPRAFGAGFGIGTICAEHGVATLTTDTAISNAKAVRMAGTANCSVIRIFVLLFNESSWLACGHFIALSPKGAIVFL